MRIIIVGAGGLGREAVRYAQDASIVIHGCIDDDHAAAKRLLTMGLSYLGSIADAPLDAPCLIAIGDSVTRRHIASRLQARGATFASVIHPSAIVHGAVGSGCIVAPFAFIGDGASLGDHGQLNTFASLGHDATTGPYATLSPYASLGGGAVLGAGVFLGSHAAIAPRIQIGAWSKISIGTAVSRDLSEGSLASSAPPTSRILFAPPSLPDV